MEWPEAPTPLSLWGLTISCPQLPRETPLSPLLSLRGLQGVFVFCNLLIPAGGGPSSSQLSPPPGSPQALPLTNCGSLLPGCWPHTHWLWFGTSCLSSLGSSFGVWEVGTEPTVGTRGLQMRTRGPPRCQDHRYLQADVPQLRPDFSHQRHVLAVDEVVSAPILNGRRKASPPSQPQREEIRPGRAQLNSDRTAGAKSRQRRTAFYQKARTEGQREILRRPKFPHVLDSLPRIHSENNSVSMRQ